MNAINDTTKHIGLIGTSGSGKSYILENYIKCKDIILSVRGYIGDKRGTVIISATSYPLTIKHDEEISLTIFVDDECIESYNDLKIIQTILKMRRPVKDLSNKHYLLKIPMVDKYKNIVFTELFPHEHSSYCTDEMLKKYLEFTNTNPFFKIDTFKYIVPANTVCYGILSKPTIKRMLSIIIYLKIDKDKISIWYNPGDQYQWLYDEKEYKNVCKVDGKSPDGENTSYKEMLERYYDTNRDKVNKINSDYNFSILTADSFDNIIMEDTICHKKRKRENL